MHHVFTRHTEIRGRKEGVNCDPKCVVEQSWDNPGREWATKLQAGVRIAFNQHNLEVFVDHEVKPKDFKRMLPPMQVYFSKRGYECLRH